MNIQRVHKLLDILKFSKNKKKVLAAYLKLSVWEKDVCRNQMWRMRDCDTTICKVFSSSAKKIQVEVYGWSEELGETKKRVFFSRSSFLNKWERMF